MNRIIDSHIHIDKFIKEPGPDFDFFNPPEVTIAIDEIIELMDKEGVERAVIMQHPNGPINEDVGRAIQQYPNRFRGAMILNLADESCLDEMDAYKAQGMSIIKLEMFGTSLIYPSIQLDDALLMKVFKKAEKLGLVVVVDPFRMDMDGYQPDVLDRVIPQFPTLKFVIAHLGFPLAELMAEPEFKGKWETMIALAKYENVWFDVSAMPDMFRSVEAYPYQQALELIRSTKEVIGSNKLIWGSDILGELKVASYRQLIDMFKESPLLSEEDKNKILYANSIDVYFGS